MNLALFIPSRAGLRFPPALLLVAVLPLTSCMVHRTRSGPGPVPGGEPAASSREELPPELRTLRRTLTPGASRSDRPLEAVVLGHGPVVTLVVAGIHGDDPSGPKLAERLERAVLARPEWLAGRTLVLVPRANPDGLARGSRYNAGGVDLEGDFRAETFADRRRGGPGPTAEPETLALAGLIETWEPARVVAIGLPVGGLVWQGGEAAETYARALVGHAGLPLRRAADREGALGTWVAETRDAPFVAVELPAGERGQEALWQRYGGLMLAAFTYPDPPPPASEILAAGR
jgi:protein MpaA